jgi:hypothetical protein
MKKDSASEPVKLTWVRSSLIHPLFELRSDRQVIGRLHVLGAFQSAAQAEANGSSWVFTCTHFVVPRVSVRTEEIAYLASFEGSRSGAGWLQFLDGRKFRWDSADYWQKVWRFTAQDGAPLLIFKPETKQSVRGSVEIFPAAEEIVELRMLALLGWFIILLAEDETSGFLVPKGSMASRR